MATVQSVRPIAPGYSYSFAVRVEGEDGPAFPPGCAVRADLRDYPGAPRLAAALSTADGSILRVDDDTIRLFVSASGTAMLGNTTATLDLVRTDPEPDEWMAVRIELPVETSATAA